MTENSDKCSYINDEGDEIVTTQSDTLFIMSFIIWTVAPLVIAGLAYLLM